MKKSILFPLFIFCFVVSFSQTVSYHFAEEFYFVKEVPVTNFIGKQFRYEIAVRSSPADTLSKIRIHGIASGKGKDNFFKSNFVLESRIEQDWTIYTIAGKVQEEVQKLLFYSSVNGNGEFYFDDVNFYIEESYGKWKQLPIFNHSFEISKPDIFAGYYVSKRKSEGLKAYLSDEVYKTGNFSLRVQTSGNTPVSGIVREVLNQTPQTAEQLSLHQEFVDIAPDLMIFRTKKESPSRGTLLSKTQTR